MKLFKNALLLMCFVSVFFLIACSLDDNDQEDSVSDGDSDAEAGTVDGDMDLEQSLEDGDDELEVEPQRPEYPYDDQLRINHIQMKGTHNSYHIATDDYAVAPLEYTMQPLQVQLEEQGVRQFEIDIQYSEEDGFYVVHDIIYDNGTNCYYFDECMQQMKDWSVDHPGHHVLMVLLEPKDDYYDEKFTDKQTDIEQAILSVWGREHVLTPDDVRGDYATLNEAISLDGWPTLGEARDKVMFVLFDSSDHKDVYLDGHPNLEDRLMFTREGNLESPNAAFVKLDDPIDQAERILEASQAGFMIRTRTDTNVNEPRNNDYTRQEAALLSGAHYLSTDFPAPVEEFDYWFDMSDGNPSRCNPVTAPDFCTSEAIENLP